ncbi:MAG: hypothetical protein IJL89_05340, partial [Firmicutes bacterium]|nr:hypothetical protein [Bacillota bacterium]
NLPLKHHNSGIGYVCKKRKPTFFAFELNSTVYGNLPLKHHNSGIGYVCKKRKPTFFAFELNSTVYGNLKHIHNILYLSA